MTFFNIIGDIISLIFHTFIFVVPIIYISERVKKSKYEKSELISWSIYFLGIYAAAILSIYLHYFNPQVKEIFYAKLFTYPAMEVKLDFKHKINLEEVKDVVNALNKDFKNSEFISPSRTIFLKNGRSGGGIYSKEKSIPNQWRIKGNSLYFYVGFQLDDEKLNWIQKYLPLRFLKKEMLLKNIVVSKRISGESFPIDFYFSEMNQGIIPDKVNEIINFESFDIKVAPNTSDCLIRFAISSSDWTNVFIRFKKHITTDIVAKKSFSLNDSMLDEEVSLVASKFILKLRYLSEFSNGLSFPTQIFIDKNNNANLVVNISKKGTSDYVVQEECVDLANITFPSLMSTYIRHTILPSISKEFAIDNVTIKKVRFSPFYK